MIQVNQFVHFRALGTTYKVLSESIGGSAAIVEHTLEAKSLGAPLHKHTRENEISYVLRGELTVLQNDEVQVVKQGQFIIKPMGIFHTFWNATDSMVRFLEIIAPGNFEHYYAELAPFLLDGLPPQTEKVRETGQKYGLIVDPEQTAGIITKYGLRAWT